MVESDRDPRIWNALQSNSFLSHSGHQLAETNEEHKKKPFHIICIEQLLVQKTEHISIFSAYDKTEQFQTIQYQIHMLSPSVNTPCQKDNTPQSSSRKAYNTKASSEEMESGFGNYEADLIRKVKIRKKFWAASEYARLYSESLLSWKRQPLALAWVWLWLWLWLLSRWDLNFCICSNPLWKSSKVAVDRED